jgi:hypothetical protein
MVTRSVEAGHAGRSATGRAASPSLGPFVEPDLGAWRAWMGLIAVLLVCGAPLFVRLGEADSRRTMENIAVASSQETWLRQHGSSGSGL